MGAIADRPRAFTRGATLELTGHEVEVLEDLLDEAAGRAVADRNAPRSIERLLLVSIVRKQLERA